MNEMKISPEIERIYQQLLWVERRRVRIIGAVGTHFGKAKVEKILENVGASPLANEPAYSVLVDERGPSIFLADLAFQEEKLEATTLTTLRKHVSVYQQHVDEQILFGARTTGQEAGRAFLTVAKPAIKDFSHLDVPEAIQAVFDLTYNGLPWNKHHFLCLRSQGGSTVHYTHSPHLSAWKAAGADPRFLYSVKSEWIRGILDILSPETEFSSSQAIEQGNTFGLAHFHLRGSHAGP